MLKKVSLLQKIATLWLLLAVISCAAIPNPGPTKEREYKVRKISASIQDLGSDVDPVEARKIARTVVYYPLKLAKIYELTKPPIIHNVLVNMGSKPRGLCYHWANDILDKLEKQNPQTVNLYWAIANKGKPREHSSLVVTAKNQDFYQGLVFDGWRKSGNLYWTKIADDPKYKWHPHIKKR